MTAEMIDGRLEAAQLKDEVARAAKTAEGALCGGLATLSVGEDYRALAYERRLRRMAEAVGVAYRHEALSGEVSQAELTYVVERLNSDPQVAGILVLRPLPCQLDEGLVFRRLAPEKDIEAVHPENAGLLALGTPRFVPSTPAAAYHLLDSWLDQAGMDRSSFYHRCTIVVVGRSNNVGKPAVSLGMDRGATVVSLDEHASAAGRLEEHTRLADVLIVAAGVAGLIRPAAVREGAVVIDVGINPMADASGRVRLVGDVDPAVAERAAAMTPVPGGVGPVTDVLLLRNTVVAAQLGGQR